MPVLAREQGATRIYLVDEGPGTRRWIKKPEYDALRALGWPAPKSIPAGTLTAFQEIGPFVPFTPEEFAAALAAAQKEQS